ncbi:MAG: GIY-YIG nuclease family protein [Campylobacterota bacterium]|nr:GIY-YIG nuclease family protein [Campylobacterota bacterium]
MIDSKKELLEAIEDDPFDLAVVKAKASNHRDIPKMVIDAFHEINQFYDKNGREPNKNNDRGERSLCAKLEGIREDSNQIAVLKQKGLDKFELLEDKSDVAIDDINTIEDDPFNLLGDDCFFDDDPLDDIFTLKNITKETTMPEYIASRKKCEDFEKYQPLFKQLQDDLKNKKRIIGEYKGERFIKEGMFFVLKGVVGYVAKVGKLKKQNNVKNARLECIFENGTKSDMLLRSLSAELYKDGNIISQLDSEVENELSQVNKDDSLSGYIYILKSLSNDISIRDIENLYKVGYSTTEVKHRIKNAKKEPTYLMADVQIVSVFETYNLNTQKFEQLLHQFFGNSCLDIKITGEDKKEHTPREWFIAPLDVIKTAILLVENGEIIHYKYDTNRMGIAFIK